MKPKINRTKRVLLVCIIAVFALLNQEIKAQTKDGEIKKSPYASMSLAEKQAFQKALVLKLKSDTDFIAMNKLLNGFIDESIKRRSKGLKPSNTDKNPNSPQSKKRKEDMLELVIKTATLMKKYPDLRQLDKESRKAVFKQASTKEST